MAEELVPESVAWDDNLRIAFVPDGEAVDPKSVATLSGATTKDVTYSLKAFNRSITEATIEDPRLTLAQVLQKRGKVTESLEVQYVFGDPNDVAAAALTKGQKGWLVARYSTPNATDWEVGQEVDVIRVEAGKQRKDAPVENGVQTITQSLFVIGVTEDDAELVA